MDLTGISNHNAFYSPHYLAAIVAQDLKQVFQDWNTQDREGIVSPPRALEKCARGYFAHSEQLRQQPHTGREQQQAVTYTLLAAAGYTLHPETLTLEDAVPLPVLARQHDDQGRPVLWVLEALPDLAAVSNLSDEYMTLTALEARPRSVQFAEDQVPDAYGDLSWEEIISQVIFAQGEPPRFVLLTALSEWVLIDRHKWHEKKCLRFGWEDILGRKTPETLQITMALLHHDSLCPEGAEPLLDTLNASSHKHAYGVTGQLKAALRDCIEDLGNEVLYYLREVSKKKVYNLDQDLAEQLSREALRYMYRLLFLFYIEARPELGYAPVKSQTYLSGYSLESLRELEMVPLSSEAARQGYYFDESLKLLFTMIYQGMSADGLGQQSQTLALNFADDADSEAALSDQHSFRMSPLESHLFDPERTPLMNSVKLRNEVLQRVIQRMSLSAPEGKGKFARRGRISYAQLGINQLGQVYEALLSYRGFFAEAPLYEVKPKGESWDPLNQGFFVPEAELTHYSEAEKVIVDGQWLRYPKGHFLYRLAGRDRQNSASYYTPEVLTECLVKYALKELLQDKSADEILNLTVCEPAMGSAAFLNAAINALAESYLQRKQQELGQRIAHDRYSDELQKVKMYFADNQVFGVDLNPVAVELAEISLWLNTLFAPEGDGKAFVPWFGLQLICGNSLIGAKRAVYTVAEVQQKYYTTAPQPLPLKPDQLIDGIWHFVLPDPGMGDYTDKVVKSLAAEELNTLKQWRSEFCAPLQRDEIDRLRELSQAIERLWLAHVEEMQALRQKSTDRLPLWPSTAPIDFSGSIAQKDKALAEEFYSRGVRNSSAYQRLKLVMDYYCALWFWPLDQVQSLPSRADYLDDLTWICSDLSIFSSTPQGEDLPLFAASMTQMQQSRYENHLGTVDLAKLKQDRPRLQAVESIAQQQRFTHWELEFADVFARKGGFDLVIGNPPWIKPEWNEGGLMGDHDPRFVLQKFSASKLAALREETLEKHNLRSEYLKAYQQADGTKNFLNAQALYPLLKGMKANLYKCFITRGWELTNGQGVTAFVHPEGVYDDPRGGSLREALYPKLRYHFQFQNEFALFEGTNDHGRMRFGLSVYGSQGAVSFSQLNNLYTPMTVDRCFEHPGYGPVGGIKDDENNWNVNGHRDRIISVNQETLRLFASLYDKPGTPDLQARLPVVHSTQVVEVLRKFAEQTYRLGDTSDSYYSTDMWNETNAQKDGSIRRDTQFSENAEQWVLSGPHFFVGNPLNKTPRAECTQNSHYDVLDLDYIPDDYLPRTNYVPDCDPVEYLKRTPKVPWDKRPVTDYYRLVFRKRLNQSGERTLIPCLTHTNTGHIMTVISTSFKSSSLLLGITGLMSSLPMDFYVKTTGMADFTSGSMIFVPQLQWGDMENILLTRVLTLNCLTTHYADLWQECWKAEFQQQCWASDDPRLPQDFFAQLTPDWQRHCALRSDYARRQALVEIDVLAALALGLSLEELQSIYRIQFPVMRQYEQDTFYDTTGRIVFTASKGLPGVGLPRKGRKEEGVHYRVCRDGQSEAFEQLGWEDVCDMATGAVEKTFFDDTLPGGSVERTVTYHAPFLGADREADYAKAWAVFSHE